MANSSTGNQIYLCHFCSKEFYNRPTLFAHFSHCKIRKSTKQFNENIHQLPQLNQTQLNILYMVKLHPSNTKLSSNNFLKPEKINLEIPLSNLYSHGYLSSSNQSSFDDSVCNLNETEIYIPSITNEENSNLTLLNNKILSYHIYKYSRREHKLYYNRIKHSIKKQHMILTITPPIKKSYSKQNFSLIFHKKNFLINIPTKIYSQQRIKLNKNFLYPLLFSPNFNTLVQLPTNILLNNYLFYIRIYFHLIHSIASQEFQIIVHNYDHQHEFSYTSLSFMNILRQTMLNYTTNLQTTFKRNYFHTEDDDDNEHESTLNHDNELSIPPLKIRRYDDSSYEIDKRSISSSTSSSSSSGISITQINNGQQYDDRRRFETRHKKFSSRISDNQINSNFNDLEKKDITHLTVDSSLQNDLSFIDHHQQSKDRTSTEPFLSSSHSYTSEQKPKKSISPILIKEHSNDSQPKYHTVVLNEGARIRIVNCANDTNRHLFSRNNSISNSTRKYSNSMDENGTTKSTRINTRKISSTNSKSSDISEIFPTYQAQSVLLSNNEISNQWLIHNVFYRCHACSHEEFFVNLSRECIRLHISSKHGNMEENFKQRISNFLNNQGRALKIFQHYLKWQQPWSEKEIDQIFQLSNINNRTNGAL